MTKTIAAAAALFAIAFSAAAMPPAKYPVVCTDNATGEVVLVADGAKVRVAYWDNDKPYFTKGNRAAVTRNPKVFAAPKNSTCRLQDKT